MEDRPPDLQENIPTPFPNPSTGLLPCENNSTSADLQECLPSTVKQIATVSSSPANTTSDLNHRILIRRNSSTSKITPPHQTPDYSNTPNAIDDSSKKPDHHITAGEGAQTIQNDQAQHKANTVLNVNHFPKISNNFDKTVPNIAALKQKFNDTSRPTVRQNATMSFNASNHQNGVSAAAPPPPNVIPTFASKLRAIPDSPQAKIQLQPVKRTTKQGLPAVIFNRHDYMFKLAERCKFTVVGKFSSNMPKMEVIRRSLTSQLQINGTIKVTHFNSRHVYIDLDNELDHSTVWHKGKMFVEGMCMRLFVWTPTFKPQEETPIAPVWVILPELPWHCYCMEVVSPLLEDLGKALFLDAASFKRTRGSVAKVKLELDLTRERPKHIWMGYDDDEFGDGRWQEVQYENVPPYCSHCKHQGHAIHACTVKAREDIFQKQKVEEMQKNTVAPINTVPKQHGTDRERDLMLQVKRGQEEPQATANDRKAKRGKPPNLQYVPKNPSVVEKGDVIGNGSAREPQNHPVENVELLCNNPFEILSKEESADLNAPCISKAPSLDVVTDKKFAATDLAPAATFNANESGHSQAKARAPVEVHFVREGPLPAAVHSSIGDVPVVHNAITELDELQCNKYVKQVATTEVEAAIAFHDSTDALKISNTSNYHVLAEKNTIPVGTHDDTVVLTKSDAVPIATAINDLTGKGEESTKAWVVRSFGTSPITDKASSTVDTQSLMLSQAIPEDKPTAPNPNSEKKKTCTGSKKSRKKQRKKADEAGNKETEPLNVQENKATHSVPSQDSFDPTNAITMGRDNDDIDNGRALIAYVSPSHSGNALIPTARLEVMCKQASKVMKEIGRGCFPVTPQARIDSVAQEAPTYFLGDLFADSQMDQKEPSKDVKSKWNVNAPSFIPTALRLQEPQVVPFEIEDLQDGADLEFPTGPSDEVLLQRMDLYDIRRLLHRQNSPPQDLPQKFLSPHPGIIEDGSEYEDEDEDSTAYNDMAEARYAGLSPRVEQTCRPKLIKKMRRPLEPKKEAAPKKPKRVQPTRNIKSRYSRRK